MANGINRISGRHLSPNEFDSKLSELRNIAERMRHYNHKTPSNKVIGDHKAALEIYQQLKETLSSLNSDDSLDDMIKDINRELSG